MGASHSLSLDVAHVTSAHTLLASISTRTLSDYRGWLIASPVCPGGRGGDGAVLVAPITLLSQQVQF